MPKVNLDEAHTILDPLLSDNFELTIPKPPVGDAERLRIHCKTAIKPGMTIEEVLVEVFGHSLRHAGRKTFSGTMSVTYVENKDLVITKIFEEWNEMERGTKTQSGAFKSEYSTDAYFTIFDQKGNEVAKYVIHGVWPKTVPELNFDNGAQALEAPIEFSFDYYEPA